MQPGWRSPALTLRWASNGIKDYEAPNDADTNNVYLVQVRATDGLSNTADQSIAVTVTDIAMTDPNWTNVKLLLGFEGANNSTGAPGMTDASAR